MLPVSAAVPVADEADRRRFVSELDRNFCVSASAGAGKTTAIVRRIAAMVRENDEGEDDPAARLVVVTYTRAAAAELRVRAREELQRDAGATPELTARRLRRLNGAFFGTLHGFTLELLRRYGGALGLPADAELLEEVDEPVLWERFLADEVALARALDHEWYAAALRHATFAEMTKLASKLTAAEAAELLEGPGPGKQPEVDFREVLAFVPKGRGSANDEKNRAMLRRWHEDWVAGEDYLPIPKVAEGSRAFRELAEAALKPVRDHHRVCLGRAAARLAQGFLAYRLALGRMTYGDMIYWGRRLLDDAGTLKELRERRFIILLDEAQDTEPDMFDVLLELARPVGAPVGDWPGRPGAEPPEPGRFCFVGDDQQTIYGDARNLKHYQGLVGAFARGSGGEALSFTVTMRLSEAAIEVVNRIFAGREIHAGVGEEGGGTFRPLVPKPAAHPGRVTRLKLAPPPPELAGETIRIEDEAAQTGRWLRQQGLAGLGIDRWDAVAVLAPRNDWLDRIREGLKRVGLPVDQLSSRQPRGHLPAFSWPMATLRVMLRPDDTFELIGVLREVFVISDRVMAEAEARGSGCLRLDGPEPATGFEELDGALITLRALRKAVVGPDGHVPVGQAVELVRERLGLDQRLEAAGFDQGPLEWLRDQAAAAEASGLGLGGWLEEMRVLADRPLPLAPVGDAIQLLNCHKAKGLEWDVVVLLGIGRKFVRRSDQYPRVERTSQGLHVTTQKEDRVEEEEQKAADVAENGRLLYVAMTRAKRHLVLADPEVIYGRGEPFLPGAVQGTFVTNIEMPTEVPPTEAEGLPEVPAGPEPAPPTEPEPLVAPQPVRRVLPSSLGHGAGLEEGRRLVEFEQMVGGVDYGTWWHETMQFFPWRGTAEEQKAHVERARTEAAERGLGERAVKELEVLMAADFWRSWGEAGRVVLTEVPFLDPVREDEWLDGVIDLVVTGPGEGKALVVDWKTDRPAKGESREALAARLKETYGPQLRSYRETLLRLPGIKSCGLALYATATGQWIELA